MKTTIWLSDQLPCNKLSCNIPSPMVIIEYQIYGSVYYSRVRVIIDDPLTTPPFDQRLVFKDNSCC